MKPRSVSISATAMVGAIKPVAGHDDELFASAEETTNLPFELQAALDAVDKARQSMSKQPVDELAIDKLKQAETAVEEIKQLLFALLPFSAKRG